MHVTLGEEGSGFSKAQPRFLPPPVGNIGEAWPAPFMLALVLSLRLSEAGRERGAGSRARPGLRMDFDEIFMEEKERRDVKQMKSSLLDDDDEVLPVVR